MADLTNQALAAAGAAVTFAAAAGGGDTFTYKNGLLLVIWNDGGAAERTVTLASHYADAVGSTAANKTLAVGVDEVVLYQVNALALKNTSTGKLDVSYDAVTNLKIAAVEL